MNAWVDVPLELAVSKEGISYLKGAGRENGDFGTQDMENGVMALRTPCTFLSYSWAFVSMDNTQLFSVILGATLPYHQECSTAKQLALYVVVCCTEQIVHSGIQTMFYSQELNN